MLDADDRKIRNQSNLLSRRGRDDQSFRTGSRRQLRERHDSLDRPNRTIERELTSHRPRLESPPPISLRSEPSGTCEYTRRDRQVVHRPFLPKIRRSQVDGQSGSGPRESGIADGGSNPLRRFSYGCIGQAHDPHRRKSLTRKVHFDATGLGAAALKDETRYSTDHDTTVDEAADRSANRAEPPIFRLASPNDDSARPLETNRLPVGIRPNRDDKLLDSPDHGSLVRWVEHIDSISFDGATAIKNRNDMLRGIARN